MATSPLKIQNHKNNRNEIKAVALQQLAEAGAAGLSLGAIARQVGVTTPALYRYFESREALLAELMQEALFSMTSALDDALEGIPGTDYKERFQVTCFAYYQWAVAHPREYGLLFGPPAPGCRLEDSVAEAAHQCLVRFLRILGAADLEEKVEFSGNRLPLHPALTARLKMVQFQQKSYSEKVTYLALSAWSFIHGMASLELNGCFSSLVSDQTEDFAKLEIRRFVQSIGLK